MPKIPSRNEPTPTADSFRRLQELRYEVNGFCVTPSESTLKKLG